MPPKAKAKAALLPMTNVRPLITRAWREENPEEWQRLWDSSQGRCPVCMDETAFKVYDSPMNSDIPTRCTHFACFECWRMIASRDRRCPLCRDDLTEWLWFCQYDFDALPSESSLGDTDMSEGSTDDQ